MSRSRISQALSIAALLAACSHSNQQAFISPILEAHPAWQATPEAIRVSIEPITRENLPDFSELGRAAMWREPDPKSLHPIGGPPPYRVEMMERISTFALVPLPAFHLSVENGGKRPLSFNSHIELVDDLQRPYRPILDTDSLKSRMVRDIFGTNSYVARDAPLMRRFSEGIDELTILTPTLSIEPGSKWVGYLFFETGVVGADDYNQWMSTVSRFTLRLKGSSEGGPDFVFNLDKRNRSVTLICPSYVKLPSLESCSRLEQ